MLIYFSSFSPSLVFYISLSIVAVLEKNLLEISRSHCGEFEGCGFMEYDFMLLVDMDV